MRSVALLLLEKRVCAHDEGEVNGRKDAPLVVERGEVRVSEVFLVASNRTLESKEFALSASGFVGILLNVALDGLAHQDNLPE